MFAEKLLNSIHNFMSAGSNSEAYSLREGEVKTKGTKSVTLKVVKIPSGLLFCSLIAFLGLPCNLRKKFPFVVIVRELTGGEHGHIYHIER